MKSCQKSCHLEINLNPINNNHAALWRAHEETHTNSQRCDGATLCVRIFVPMCSPRQQRALLGIGSYTFEHGGNAKIYLLQNQLKRKCKLQLSEVTDKKEREFPGDVLFRMQYSIP